MKKIFFIILCLFSFIILIGCDNTLNSNNKNNNDEYTLNKDNLTLTDELNNIFKEAYIKSITIEDEEINLNSISILDYYGKIKDSYLVSIIGGNINKYPNDAYIQTVENMEFRYDMKTRVYIINNQNLYTAKEAYEAKLINFDNLCLIFGLHTSKLDTFNTEKYNIAKKGFEKNLDEELLEEEAYELFELARYYGEYNGHIALSYNFLGGESCVIFEEKVSNLTFSYGYQTNRIRFINEDEVYFLEDALENNIINKDQLYELFKLHTRGELLNDELVETLIAPAYALYIKYQDYCITEPEYVFFYITNYFGKYGDSYIFSLNGPWISHTNIPATPEEKEIMEYGFSSMAYVLNNENFYTLDQALRLEIITEEIKEKIVTMYYSI